MGLNFQRFDVLMRPRNRLCCSFSLTSSQYFSRMIPSLTMEDSNWDSS